VVVPQLVRPKRVRPYLHIGDVRHEHTVVRMLCEVAGDGQPLGIYRIATQLRDANEFDLSGSVPLDERGAQAVMKHSSLASQLANASVPPFNVGEVI